MNSLLIKPTLLAVLIASASTLWAAPATKALPFSPYADSDKPDNVYWGDTHLHTSLSMDAGALGNRLTPDDAYRFARGEQITASLGTKAKLSRPLDWLVVADHSDNMGLFTLLNNADPSITDTPLGKSFSDKVRAGGKQGAEVAFHIIKNFSANNLDKELEILPGSEPYQATWNMIVDSAEKYNDPGQFTAFIGYEWTSLVKGNNMHRVVIYKEGAKQAKQVEPYTMTPPHGSPNPRDLWKWMGMYEQKTNGRVLAIAHNGNLANGIMFPNEAQYDGATLDKFYVEERIKREPLYEITQIKGDGEAHPFLSPNDEFADYETWDKANLSMSQMKESSMLKGEYAREALKTGLKLETQLGTNPYKMGFIGSTDSHTGLATAQEDNFFGKHSGSEPSAKRAEHVVLQIDDQKIMGWKQVASGLAAIWAKDNTREALFEAMERKETYATTGSRMKVRFFGGWNFTSADATASNAANIGYSKGVPMGGDLPKKAGKAPSFMVQALRDPLSGNLDRIQIVKGWLDGKGNSHERIYDVAVSDGRKIAKDGRCKTPVGNTVDIKNATWSNSIGEAQMMTTWVDPDFDAAQSAVYYARVIEIPTPRWTAYEAKRYGVEMPKGSPMTTQERAYTSPIWYTP